MNSASKDFQKNAMTSFIQIAAVVLLLTWCFRIVSPFIGIVAWGMIIAVAVYPLHLSVAAKLGDRPKSSATLFVLLGLAILLVPTYYLAESSVDGLRYLAAELSAGTVTVPPPNESVAGWPLIGEKVFAIWSGAAANLEETLNTFEPQLRAFGQSLVQFAGSSALGVLQFVVSFIVAGVFLVSAENGYRVTNTIATRLSEDFGQQLTDMSIATIRSVAKGVLGVAVIQSLLSAIGLVAIGVPGAGLWAGVILVLAIIQLPPLLILGPIAIWVFSVADTTPATLFAIYALLVSASDGFLKPLLLGRGLDIPMLVILLGAIGGMMLSGIIGLFIGAVILAVGYQILMAWMMAYEQAAEAAATTDAA